MNIQQAIQQLVDGDHLSREEMREVMTDVMSGANTAAQIAGLLVALRIRGETIDEIAGAAEVMRSLAKRVHVDQTNLVDLVGTGGDGANLFNVSTASTFVVAAAGGRVAKHGNRSVSSSSGSSDVLEALGVPLDLTPEQIARCVDDVGVGFMFAPAHHGAMKYAVEPRKDLGMRTLFNILGPLTNPAHVERQVLGVFSPDLCQTLASALGLLGLRHALVVHSNDGLDEISIAAPTRVSELRDGDVERFTIDPADYDQAHDNLEGLVVDTAQESADLIRAALGGKPPAEAVKARSMIALNAGAAIYVSGVARSLRGGIELADDLVSTGQAMEKLESFIAYTNGLKAGDL
ncbi:anthranilate phosphoribosyltransferase [Luminiphilus syltensis NOR5-1B]|uniref:Anthranilate phosphoribosyltransferase n=1 Tax=Luminiphilus syltensis NOR5-1B TaxID=565045 RepID=B8KVZ5_9GAMM|nr:anthranilate phosphoribosyltransferase [Luminiphilus syltensis]EED34146.1 anthranilate phosphoribosyltransferase [Luminiphilus syltensis NOR5-1B]